MGRRLTCTGIALGTCWSLFLVACDPGLRVGAVSAKTPDIVSGEARLEIDGVPSTPVAIMTGASELLPRLSIRNAGQQTAHNVQLSLNPPPPPLHVAIAADGCSGRSLNPGESCSLDLTVMPEASGEQLVTVVATATENTARATVRTMAAGLTAAVDTSGVLSAPSGCPSMEVPVRVTNQGHLTSVLSYPQLSAGLRDNQQGTCVAGASLAPGKECVLYVRALPQTVGVGTETVTLSGSPGGTTSVTLPTLGLADFVVAPLALTLTSPDGSRVLGIVTLSVGATPRSGFDLSGPGTNAFAVSSTCVNTIAACSSCQVFVGFTPPGPGTFTGNLNIYSMGLVTTVQLTGVR